MYDNREFDFSGIFLHFHLFFLIVCGRGIITIEDSFFSVYHHKLLNLVGNNRELDVSGLS